MRNAVRSVALSLLLLATVAQAGGPGTKVHISRTGHKYHRAGCRYLSHSDIVVTLKEAKDRGLTPLFGLQPANEVKRIVIEVAVLTLSFMPYRRRQASRSGVFNTLNSMVTSISNLKRMN